MIIAVSLMDLRMFFKMGRLVSLCFKDLLLFINNEMMFLDEFEYDLVVHLNMKMDFKLAKGKVV